MVELHHVLNIQIGFISIFTVPLLFLLLKWDVRFMNLDSRNSQRHNGKNITESNAKNIKKNKTLIQFKRNTTINQRHYKHNSKCSRIATRSCDW